MDPGNPRGPPRPEDQDYARPWEHSTGYPTAPQQQQHPQHDYGGYAYGPPPHPPINTGFNPPPPHQLFSQMPPWPSMLSNPSMYPPQPIQMPQTTPRVRHSTSGQGSTPRKTLTDEDRRRMCQYHQDHPNTKQTEIGAIFGVERSTVSKVLRQKDKYLYPDDGSRSPIKRAKGKFPDIEKGLSNWAKSTQAKGELITDQMIREKADFFARTLDQVEGVDKMKTSSWIRKFKQKHNVGLKREFEEITATGGDDGLELQDSNGSSEAHNSGHISPGEFGETISPNSARPYDMIKASSPDSYGSGQYHKNSLPPGATPISSVFSENQSYYTSTSPHSTFYSPDPQSTPNPFLTPPLHRLPPISDQLQNQPPPRPRSQTFPTAVNPDYPQSSSPQSHNPLVMGPPSLPTHLGLGIEAHHHHHQQAQAHQQQQQQQQHQPPSGRMSIIMTDAPPPDDPHHQSMPPRVGSPTQGEAKRGMETVMAFLDAQPPGVVAEEGEYIALQRVMTRLALGAGAEEEHGHGNGGQRP